MTTSLTLDVQGPLDTLPYNFPFADFLATVPGDSIASWSVQADPGIVLSSGALGDDQSITVDVSGGLDTYAYNVVAQVTTVAGLVSSQGIIVRIRGAALTGQLITGTGLGGGTTVSALAGTLSLDFGAFLLDGQHLIFIDDSAVPAGNLLLDTSTLFLDSNLLVIA